MLTALTLLGGLGLFLIGMRLLTEGLKIAAGEGLRSLLRASTRSPLRGLAAGALVTSVVQSSSAVTVATIGFVNAGLLTLGQAVWLIFGTNVGTTMTGWLVAGIGVKVDIGALALPILGIGAVLHTFASRRPRIGGIGEALAGFGLFFLGIGILRDGFGALLPVFSQFDFSALGLLAPLLFVLLGAALTVFTQSSSAAIALILTANAGGGLAIDLAAAAVIGANIGTTSTAALASIGATPPARRVAAAHIIFNLSAGAIAMLLLPVLLGVSHAIADYLLTGPDEALTLAFFNTIVNLLGVLAVWPLAGRLVARLQTMFVTQDEMIARPRYLDPTLAEVPALALRGLVLEISRLMDLAFGKAEQRLAGNARHHQDTTTPAALSGLGQAIRDFISRLSRTPLPSETVDALPDLIRAIHHIDELGSELAELSDPPPQAGTNIPDEQWHRLNASVANSLRTSARNQREYLAEYDSEYAETDAAYEAIKARLLSAAASGRVNPAEMEAALLHARRLRRIAAAALKAGRRLAPWKHLMASPVSPTDADDTAEASDTG